jgi:hypothetical protein
MSDVTVKLSDATPAQLRYFAEVVLGIPLGPNPNIKAETLIAKIASVGYQRDEIAVPESVGQPVATVTAAIATGEAPSPEAEPVRTILINRSDEPGGDQPVWVSVNGRGMFIPRGVPAKIKQRYVDVLRNAVRTVYEQGSGTHDPIVARDVQAYPFSIIA